MEACNSKTMKHCYSKEKKKIIKEDPAKKIQRFSKIDNVQDVPFFQFYNPKPDPIIKLEKRKMKKKEYPIKKPKLRMKCITCKEKKEKNLETEERKIDVYPTPITAKQIKENDERHRKEKEKFFVCKKEVIRLPSPVDLVEAGPSEIQYESAAQKSNQLNPEKMSLTESIVQWPENRFESKPEKPEKPKKTGKKFPPVDSLNYLYSAEYRKLHPWYVMYRGSDTVSLEPFVPGTSVDLIEEEEKLVEEINKENAENGEEAEIDIEETDSLEKEQPATKKRSTTKSTTDEDATSATSQQGLYEPIDVSKLSAATSIDSEYRLKRPSDEELDNASLVPNVVNRIMQKYHDSDTDVCKKESRIIRRGTITSHSVSKVPKLPQKFFFGVKSGTVHYGDATFSPRSRYKQGLPICVAAYIYSFIKQASKWTSQDINKVLDYGDKLYLKSLETLHLHETPRILNPEDLCEVLEICDRKIKFEIDDPDIAGFTRSEDPKVFNLHKGLILFFDRNRSGILQTYNTNILIWKQKHFYVFDPEPRNEELFYDQSGHSVIANLYDIPAVASMLLNRGKIENWPFIISKITIKKIISDNKDDGDSISSELREENLYKIINPSKACISGSLSISDECFGDLKNRQGFAVATMALIYNQLSPACSWHRQTVDKILRVSNQFFIECLKDTTETELKLENLPAFFTIGPLMVEILIYGNQFAGLMFKKSVCLFEILLQNFFYSNTAAIIEIDKYVIAVWKTRDVYYQFDPYSRDTEGFKVKNGAACVTMNTNLESVVGTILNNFPQRDYLFKIHIMKVIKINRDPEFGKFPRNLQDSEASFIESIKITDKRAFSPKNITIDRTEFAMRSTAADQSLDPSIIEVGSFVGSLEKKYVPVIDKCPPNVAKVIEAPIEKLVDLDSASLSDTQIEKAQPRPNRSDSFEYKLIEELFKQQQRFGYGDLDGEYGSEENEDCYCYLNIPFLTGEFGKDGRGKHGGLSKQDEMTQKGRDYGFLHRTDADMNTELLGLAVMPKVVLEANRPPKTSRKRRPKVANKNLQEEIRITQSLELKKPTNFIGLPDNADILYGTKNITRLGENYEESTPFVSIVAIVMEKKYTLITWSREVVDAVLDYGVALYKTVECKFADVPRIVVPRLVIGRDSYHVRIDYLFDSLLAQTILEQCLEKLVFREREACVIVTKDYSCAVFLKRKLYYMYDGFGNNLVGIGEGPENTGVACLLRFKTIHLMVNRFLFNKKQREIIEPTEATRFIISTVEVKTISPPSAEHIPRREKQYPAMPGDIPKPHFQSNPMDPDYTFEIRDQINFKPINLVGYQKKGNATVIEGHDVLTNRGDGNGEIKACHFIGVCAMIGIFGRPIKTWDTKRIDYVIETGNKLFGFVDNLNFADKRNISNLLFDKYYYDIIVKRIISSDQKKSKNFKASIDQLLLKNKFLLIQFPNCCFVLYHGNKYFHLFDPYGIGDNPKACWIRFEELKKMISYIKKSVKGMFETFFFYTIFVCKMKKAPKKVKMDYKLRTTAVKKKKKVKRVDVFYEDEDWLLVYPIPWARLKKTLGCGQPRGLKEYQWHNWDIEYPSDLYSLTSTIHQTSHEFPRKNRGKQTIANCIVAIIMTEIYDFTEWNSEIMDAILKDGNQYFTNTVNQISEENHEIRLEDFQLQVLVFPYSVKINMYPLIEGTLFVIKSDQFNLSKALQFFFAKYENQCGVICCNNGAHTKYLAFGRIREHEYFMYDCSSIGPPMFFDRSESRAYILRCMTLNRLIYIMTLTLRAGDFFIYYVGLAEDQEVEDVLQDVNYEEEEPKEKEVEKTEGVKTPIEEEMTDESKNWTE